MQGVEDYSQGQLGRSVPAAAAAVPVVYRHRY